MLLCTICGGCILYAYLLDIYIYIYIYIYICNMYLCTGLYTITAITSNAWIN